MGDPYPYLHPFEAALNFMLYFADVRRSDGMY